MIWVRSLISAGGDGKLYYRYAVIEKGLLNFYRSESVSNYFSTRFSYKTN